MTNEEKQAIRERAETPQHWNNAINIAREDTRTLLAEVERLSAQVAEIRKLAVTDFYDGTGPDAGHWWRCQLCCWSWRSSQPPSHEEPCPLSEAQAALK